MLSEMQEDRSACVKHTHDMSARRGARVAGEKWSRDDFADRVCVSREIMEKLDRYLTLVQEWNPKASLVSKAGMEDPWRRHLFDSAQLLDFLPTCPGDRRMRIMDVGSGGGFPGMVLAILCAEAEVHLIESRRKKAEFLAFASRQCATPVHVFHGRVESFPAQRFDCLTARAVAPVPRLLKMLRPFFAYARVVGLFHQGKKLVREELEKVTMREQLDATWLRSRSAEESFILRVQSSTMKERSVGECPERKRR